MAAEVAVEGPLRIDEVNYPDPAVTFCGPEWSLGMLCTWRLLRNGDVVVDPDNIIGPFEIHTETVTDAIWDLIGHEIVGVTESPLNPNDPVFELTGGYTIEVAAETDLDPWVLGLPNIVFVGTMTSPPQ